MKVSSPNHLQTTYKSVQQSASTLRHLSAVQQRCEKTVLDEIDYDINYEKAKRQSAVKIQSYVRGYLLRLKLDDAYLTRRQQEMHYSILKLSEQTEHCLLDLGTHTAETVKFLQTNIRIFLWRRKIYYLGLCYELFVESKLEGACSVLRPFIRVYCCKIKLIIKQIKSYKKKVLKKVNRRLAVLTIKKAWKDNGLTFQIMRDRLAKRKRRWLAKKSKAIYKKVMTSKFASSAIQKHYRKQAAARQSVKDSYTSLGTNEASSNNLTENEKEEEGSSTKISQSKISSQTKISQSIAKMGNLSQGIVPMVTEEENLPKRAAIDSDDSELDQIADEYDAELIKEMMLRRISYKIRDMKDINLEPLFQAKKNSNISLPTKCTLRKGNLKRQDGPEGLGRNTITQSPVTVNRKRGPVSSLPPLPLINTPRVTPFRRASPVQLVSNEHFMKKTSSFIRRLKANKPERTVRKNPVFFAPPKKKLLRETISFHSKIHSKSEVPREKLWIPTTKRAQKYLPGLENSAFVPRDKRNNMFTPVSERALFAQRSGLRSNLSLSPNNESSLYL